MSLFFTISSFSQTKKEKKVETIGIKSGMYKGSESKEATQYFDQASEKSIAKDYKGAIKLYEKALKEDPNFIEAYDNIGLSYRKLGDFKNAISNYKKSIELYPEGRMAHMNLGIVYNIQKEYDKAIAEYEIIQKNDPEDPEGYYGAISPYLMKGDFKSAIKTATKTVELYEATNSEYLSQAQYLLGISYYYDKDKVNAKTYIEQAKKNGFNNVPQDILKELEIE